MIQVRMKTRKEITDTIQLNDDLEHERCTEANNSLDFSWIRTQVINWNKKSTEKVDWKEDDLKVIKKRHEKGWLLEQHRGDRAKTNL